MGFHPFTLVLSIALIGAGIAGAYIQADPVMGAAFVAPGFLLLLSVRVARQWERAVVLRLGRFHHLKGPGAFWLIPFLDTVAFWVDGRTIATTFNAEQTLTRDTVPMDVDAVLFWRVVDARKAALEVEYYQDAIVWAAQTALRDVIGKSELARMLSDREDVDVVLKEIIDARTEPWGIEVVAVEIRDVQIPQALQDAMSMQAQAEKERQARVILADSERQIAEMFRESAKSYQDSPVALHLRAMNVLLEGMRNNATVVIVPSSAVETMGLGGQAMKELAERMGALPPGGVSALPPKSG